MTRDLVHLIGTRILYNTAKVSAAIVVLSYVAPLNI